MSPSRRAKVRSWFEDAQHHGLIAHAVAGELRKRLLAAFLTSGIKIAQPQRAVLAQAAARDGTPLPGTAGAAGNVGGSA